MTLRVFAFVHLNLAFSSIEEEQRAVVLERCYWPLLRLARRLQLPLGIEASGYTLETAAALDPKWLAELRDLVTNGPCEFIGCGYSQLIGPLAPAVVNDANQRFGQETYERLLGLRPRLALVNEQAYSAGLVPLYAAHGYSAIIMEWNNPATAHGEWPREWRYFPQRAKASDGTTLPVIWNESIAFQKFQRYAHGDMELDEYLAYLRGHAGPDRAFPVYGNDVEVFDFRPGRFMTEAPIQGDGEWRRIDRLFEAVLREPNTRFVAPSAVLETLSHKDGGNEISLESAAQPLPVKKQGKYNILRWAVTGRDDLSINTRCWRIAQDMEASGATDEDWKELCYLWSSDFRTHITPKRWAAYLERLAGMESRFGRAPETAPLPLKGGANVREEGARLIVQAAGVEATLTKRRGLAIESLRFTGVHPAPLCGTVGHGTFDDIRYSADWYTGNVVFEAPAQHKVTDLESATEVEYGDTLDGVIVRGSVNTPLGPVRKTLHFSQGGVELTWTLEWRQRTVGSLRLGFVTLQPGAFDARTLAYRTHNGGWSSETFPLHGAAVDHGAPVSALVSAGQALGATEGRVEIGDASKTLVIEIDKSVAAVVAMITHQRAGNETFCQVVLSAEEVDDTRKPAADSWQPLTVRMRLSALNSGIGAGKTDRVGR